MTNYQFKNIEAVMAEKLVLKSKIAKQEEKISSTFNETKAYYTNAKNWFNILKMLIFRKSLLSNPINKFSLGFNIAKYLIKKLRR